MLLGISWRNFALTFSFLLLVSGVLAQPPVVQPHFVDITDSSVFQLYKTFPAPIQNIDLPLNPLPAPGFADWDNDGDIDLPGFRNVCGDFKDELSNSGINVGGHYRGAAWADFDKDGRVDFISVAYAGGPAPDKLYRNLGGGKFQDISEAAGVVSADWGETASWGDYDGDGDLDILVGNYSCGHLWQNNGTGSFEDALSLSGIDMRMPGVNVAQMCGGLVRPESSTFFDYDDDGWLDVYVAGRLWRNLGQGTFEDVTQAVGGLYTDPFFVAHDEGFAPADINNDGNIDLSIYYQNQRKLVAFENDPSRTKCGQVFCPHDIADLGPWFLGTKWVDIDNDGDLDLFLAGYGGDFDEDPLPETRDRWFRNDGNWHFTEFDSWRFVNDGSALYYPTVFASFGDIDGDGDMDMAAWKYGNDAELMPIVQYRLLRNELNLKKGIVLRVRVLDKRGRANQNGSIVRLKIKKGRGNSPIYTRVVDSGTNWTVDEYDVHLALSKRRNLQLKMSVSFPRRQGEGQRVVHVASRVLAQAIQSPADPKTIEVFRNGRVRLRLDRHKCHEVSVHRKNFMQN